jgi:hypothetical protein
MTVEYTTGCTLQVCLATPCYLREWPQLSRLKLHCMLPCGGWLSHACLEGKAATRQEQAMKCLFKLASPVVLPELA